MTDDEEEQFIEDMIENDPVFICSQLRAGDTLTEKQANAVLAVLNQIEDRENRATDEFERGRQSAFREVGGEELASAVAMKNEETIARLVRKHMDMIFPKHQRTVQ